MSNKNISAIIPTFDPGAQAYIDRIKDAEYQKQGISTGPIEITTEGGAAPEAPKDPLVLIPFDDGTVLKYIPRHPEGQQQIVVTAKGDQVAITRDEHCAAMITDGVNVLFRALDQKQAIENENAARELAPKPTVEKAAKEGYVTVVIRANPPKGGNCHMELIGAAVGVAACVDPLADIQTGEAAVKRLTEAAVQYAAEKSAPVTGSAWEELLAAGKALNESGTQGLEWTEACMARYHRAALVYAAEKFCHEDIVSSSEAKSNEPVCLAPENTEVIPAPLPATLASHSLPNSWADFTSPLPSFGPSWEALIDAAYSLEASGDRAAFHKAAATWARNAGK